MSWLLAPMSSVQKPIIPISYCLKKPMVWLANRALMLGSLPGTAL